MDRRTKRIIRISAVSAGSVLLLLLVGTAVVLNFVFHALEADARRGADRRPESERPAADGRRGA